MLLLPGGVLLLQQLPRPVTGRGRSTAGRSVESSRPTQAPEGLDGLTHPAGAPAPRRCYRILLAEDNPINQNLAVRLLEKHGHRVVLVANGKEAVAALERQPFDLVLMDLQMPEMDGLEATAVIRAREKRLRDQPGGSPHVPIIAMTAYAMKGDRERCLEAGMDGYVSKPVRAKELFEAIDAMGAWPEREDEAEAGGEADDIDWAAALEYVGGDRNMLRDLVAIFLDEYPRWLEELRQAVRARNLPAVKRIAHNFKGSMRLLGARPVQEAAFVLDLKSRDGNLAGAEAAAAALEAGIDCLKPALVRAAAQLAADHAVGEREASTP